jgi:hypothetical protein
VSANSEFLVSHGRAAISRCRDIDGLKPLRGQAVVIRSKRGLELGEVLCPASPELIDASAGELLRFASAGDRRQADDLGNRGRALLDDLQESVLSRGLALQPLDADLTLDGERADVNVLSWGPVQLTLLQEELRARHGIAVYFLDCSQKPETGCGSCGEGGCGSCGDGGCGSHGEGGSCGSGDCSRGPKSSDELTRYFAGLREQMKSDQRVSLV